VADCPGQAGLLAIVVVILFQSQSDNEPFPRRVMVGRTFAPATQMCPGKGPFTSQLMARSRGVQSTSSPAGPW